MTRGFFTKENAKFYNQLANKARWAPKVLPPETPKPIAEPSAIEMPKAERVRAKLEALLTDMEETDDAKELDALSRAYDRLFRAWMVLSGTPGSGQRKPPPMARQRQAVSAGPVVEMLPDAAPAPAAAPPASDPNEPNG